MNLLHLDSSIQGDGSVSRSLSRAVVEHLRVTAPDLEVRYRDLAAEPIEHVTLPTLADDEARAIMAEFKAADTIVIGAPLYNFTIPSQLKAWFDRILIRGETFRYTEDGPEGLAGDKRVVVAMSRGGVYSEGAPLASFEHGESLLRSMFAFISSTQIDFIVAEGLSLGDEPKKAAVEAALARVRELRAPSP